MQSSSMYAESLRIGVVSAARVGRLAHRRERTNSCSTRLRSAW